jgi:hypothetical protein
VGSLTLNRHAAGAAAVCVLALLLACLLSAGGPVSASSGSASPRAAVDVADEPADALFPVDGPSMAAARELAERHWGGPACNGTLTIAWNALDPGTNATASWRNPTDAWNNAGENFDCRIDFNVRADFDWAKLCSVMAHELGHLLGKQHAGDSGDLMAPVYSGPLDACEQSIDPARPAQAASVVEVEPQDDEVQVVAAPSRKRVARGRAAARRRAAARCRVARRTLERRRAVKRFRCSAPRAARRTLLRG